MRAIRFRPTSARCFNASILKDEGLTSLEKLIWIILDDAEVNMDVPMNIIAEEVAPLASCSVDEATLAIARLALTGWLEE